MKLELKHTFVFSEKSVCSFSHRILTHTPPHKSPPVYCTAAVETPEWKTVSKYVQHEAGLLFYLKEVTGFTVFLWLFYQWP